MFNRKLFVMKKIVFFLLVSLSLFSCNSNDDGNSQPQEKKELHLAVDATAAIVNQPIYFTIQNSDKEDISADLYVGNSKVDNPMVFDEVGVYDIVAKKAGYVDSNVLQVNVLKQRRKNKFQLNSQHFEVESVHLSVEQVKVSDKEQNKDLIVDKVVQWHNGELGNIYNVEFKLKTASKQGRVEVSYFVPNSSIVVDENQKIINYGERIFPNEVDEVFYIESWIITDNHDFANDWKAADSKFVLDEIVIPNRGEGVGKLGIDATAYIKIDYTAGDTLLDIIYDGDIRFIEDVEDRSNGEYFPIILAE